RAKHPYAQHQPNAQNLWGFDTTPNSQRTTKCFFPIPKTGTRSLNLQGYASLLNYTHKHVRPDTTIVAGNRRSRHTISTWCTVNRYNTWTCCLVWLMSKRNEQLWCVRPYSSSSIAINPATAKKSISSSSTPHTTAAVNKSGSYLVKGS